MVSITFPDDLIGKPHQEAVELIASWLMSSCDAALARGIDPTYVREALEDVRREIDNDIAELDAAERGHTQ